MTITYKSDVMPPTEMIVDLYNSAGLNRPTADYKRISQMYANSNLIVTAWDEYELVGISRSLTDFSYCCYLSDLAVREGYKCKGIGRRMIEITKDDPLALPVNYNEGMDSILKKMEAFTGLPIAKETELFTERRRFHAKHPRQLFKEDHKEFEMQDYLQPVLELYQQLDGISLQKYSIL